MPSFGAVVAVRRLAAAVLLGAAISPAGAADYQQIVNCQPTAAAAGPLARLIETGEGRPFQVMSAAGSRAISYAMAIQDANGRGIPNVDVEVTLPDSPTDLRFLTGPNDPPSAAKRAVVHVSDFCNTNLPNVIVQANVGTVTGTVRIVGQGAAAPLPIVARGDLQPIFFRGEGMTPPVVGVVGQPVLLQTGARWKEGSQEGPMAGLAFRFSAPANEPTLRFPDGTNAWTAGTDYNGVSSVLAMPTGPGIIDTEITYPDGARTAGSRYIILASRTVFAGDASFEYGADAAARVRGAVSIPGVDCAAGLGLLDGFRSTVRFRIGEYELAGAAMGLADNCVNGVATMPISALVSGIPFGTYTVTADVPANALPAMSGPGTITIRPSLTKATASGRGNVRIGVTDPAEFSQVTKCRIADAAPLSVSALGSAGTGPQGVELPYGALRLDLDECKATDTSGFIAQLRTPKIAVLLELDEEPAPGTSAFVFGPTVSDPSPHWHELQTTVTSRFVQFVVTDGAEGDDHVGADNRIVSLIALGVPKYAAVAGSFQDLWWAGPQENGWGLTLTQHRDTLFGALFIYDANGDPRWLVMPGGSWNADRTTYSGAVYSPKGSEDHTRLPQTFAVGPSVGSFRLTPLAYDTIRFEYTINGVSGVKTIHRQDFGRPNAFPVLRNDDLWWAGAQQDGWGFAVSQQQRNVFGVVYTYDSRGDPVWYVMPSLFLGGDPDTRMTGSIYRTRGSPWLGAAYDPGAFVVNEAGTVRLSFDGRNTGSLQVIFTARPLLATSLQRQPF